MKKINSIWFGTKFLWVGLLFLITAFILYLTSFLFDWNAATILIIVLLVLSAITFFVLLIILAIEFFQDKRMNKLYDSQKAIRIKIADSFFECQNCGNQKVMITHKYCRVCGIKFNDML